MQAQADRFPGTARHLLAAGTAGLALATGCLMPVSESVAAIVYSGPLNIGFAPNAGGIALDLATGATGTSGTPASASGFDLYLWSPSRFSVWANDTASPGSGVVSGLGSSPTQVDNLALGTVVDDAGGYSPASTGVETGGATAFRLNSAANYIGFRFFNESTGVDNFGWLQLRLGNAFNDASHAILRYAYDDTGASIVVGDAGAAAAVPEPASLALAGLAMLGVLGSRRRH